MSRATSVGNFGARKETHCPTVQSKRSRTQPARYSVRSRANHRIKAKEELSPELKGKGLSYFSPIVGLRQLFNLHTNMRPCKSYPGNPLNYRGNKITNPSGEDVPIDQVVFRENTEGHVRRRGVFPVTRVGLHRAVRKSENEEVEGQGWAGKYRAFHSHHERARLHQHLQTSIRVRQENRSQTRHADRKAECAARDRRT